MPRFDVQTTGHTALEGWGKTTRLFLLSLLCICAGVWDARGQSFVPVEQMLPPGTLAPGIGMVPAGMYPPPGPEILPISYAPVVPQATSSPITGVIDPQSIPRLRWQLEAGYTILWFPSVGFPVLATSGSNADARPGALDQANTTLFPQSFEPGNSSAFRTALTYWIGPEQKHSVETIFFMMEQRSLFRNLGSNANGEPVLARPFFNAVSNQEDADPRARPGILQGTISDAIRTRLMGAEANLRWQSRFFAMGSYFNFLAGFRWVNLDEQYQSFDTTTVIGAVPTFTTISDTFTTVNQFMGGQVGYDWNLRAERLTITLTSKFGAGNNAQLIRINGETVETNPVTNVVNTDTKGLFAQNTNVGSYRKNMTSLLSEVGGKARFDLTERLSFSVGYTYLYMTNVVRPGDQMNRIINVQPLLAPPAPPLVPGPPPFQQTIFYTHMLNLGLEFVF